MTSLKLEQVELQQEIFAQMPYEEKSFHIGCLGRFFSVCEKGPWISSHRHQGHLQSSILTAQYTRIAKIQQTAGFMLLLEISR